MATKPRIGDTLKVLLDEKSVTQYRMAIDLGMTHASVSRIINNKTKPNIDNLEKFADYFGVSTDRILGRTREDPS